MVFQTSHVLLTDFLQWENIQRYWSRIYDPFVQKTMKRLSTHFKVSSILFSVILKSNAHLIGKRSDFMKLTDHLALINYYLTGSVMRVKFCTRISYSNCVVPYGWHNKGIKVALLNNKILFIEPIWNREWLLKLN